MKVVQYNCDRCGAEGIQPHRKSQTRRTGSSDIFDQVDGPTYDLCDACNRVFRAGFMKNLEVQPT